MLTRRYRTNLNCGNCIAAVKPILDGEAGIHHWEVDTTSPDKILTIEGNSIPTQRVQELVGRAGFKVLDELPVHSTHPDMDGQMPEPAASYFPLILILAYLVGVTFLIEWRTGSFEWMRAMNHFMGGFFLVFSFFKLLDLRGFADSYSGYDIVARAWRPYGFAYPFIELALGAAYVANWQPIATNLVTLIVMGGSSVGVIQSLLQKRKIRCACLGAVFNLPMSTITLLEDGLMAFMALGMLAHLLLA
jgi:hypothetical protein